MGNDGARRRASVGDLPHGGKPVSQTLVSPGASVGGWHVNRVGANTFVHCPTLLLHKWAVTSGPTPSVKMPVPCPPSPFSGVCQEKMESKQAQTYNPRPQVQPEPSYSRPDSSRGCRSTPRPTPRRSRPYSELSSAPRIRMKLLTYAHRSSAITGASEP